MVYIRLVHSRSECGILYTYSFVNAHTTIAMEYVATYSLLPLYKHTGYCLSRGNFLHLRSISQTIISKELHCFCPRSLPLPLLNQQYTVCSETPLIWTPLGQKKVSLLERCPYFWSLYVRTVFEGSLLERCPHFRGVLIEGSHCIYSTLLSV